MSDQPTVPAGAGTPADAPAAGSMPAIMIGIQYVKDLSFENPRGPEALLSLREAPKINVEVNTSARHLGDHHYESTITIRAEAEAQDKPVFIVELSYGGVITLHENVPQEAIHPLLLIEAPRHLFPFARAIVASATRDGGFPPLMINPIDFAALYAQQHAEGEQQPQQS